MSKKRINSDDLRVIINTLATGAIHPNFYGIEIKDYILLESTIITDNIPIHFKDCIFLEKFTFYKNTSPDNINITHCYFLKGLHLYDPKFQKQLFFLKCKIKGDFLISGEIYHLAWYGTSTENCIISSSKIDLLEIGGKDDLSAKSITFLDENEITKIKLYNLTSNKVSFSYLAPTTELFNCSINSIIFGRVRNEGNLKLINCGALNINEKKSHFTVTESNLGKAEFFQFDFSSYTEVNVINSILIDCLFINTTWSNNITPFFGDQMDNYMKDRIVRNNLRHTSIKYLSNYKETKQQLKDKREVYKQIKFALSKQGDQVNEQMFHTFEMNTYNKILDWKYKTFSTKIILHLSSITSQYGQSLLRPIIFLVITNSFLLLLLHMYYQNNFAWPLDFNIKNVVNNISNFLWFSNPFRKADYLKGIPLIIDVLIRIISSYCIYNIIRATRRFIK